MNSKHKRRFVVTRVDGHTLDLWSALETDNPHFVDEIPINRVFFRARAHDPAAEHRRLERHEIEAPPTELSKAGRANASGIRVLYVADSPETAIAEIRPHIGAVVTVGRFRPRRAISVFDLSKEPRVELLDPFQDNFANELAAARLFGQLNKEFSEPIHSFTPEVSYAPTQVVAEFLAESGYAGLKYRSATNPEGRNWVFFNPDDLEYLDQESFKVTAVSVHKESYNPEWISLLQFRPPTS